MLGEFAAEAESLLAQQQKQRAEATKGLQMSMLLMEQHLGLQVDTAMAPVMANQQAIQDECIGMAKCAVQLHQKTVRWKAEHKRFKAQLAELEGFSNWAVQSAKEMEAISGKLEYVCHELSRAAKDDA
ncbi:hypothetical protein SDRG_08655 [Saprolegnia diclina VS20]|uniref:Uncharacterized protein n=1 Tax=Saprolegnia diclina (strain VS20) TaxID=1156394 RepID=T0QGY4_SAPDV|nr:hypothetical protein SDRG_08655 [Saprolegnia diclina VS20]EQC33976.1 hypothetical protein SDRG_08655 [Saprolegnia diclina VS20]|eukprot:XP_008612771.1 hypothetical protein SDRG_08655 [Saprolegnia diclina VS20]